MVQSAAAVRERFLFSGPMDTALFAGSALVSAGVVALGRAAATYGQADADRAAAADEALIVEQVPSADRGEIADLPLQLLRVTATGESGRSLVRLQADYAVDGCEDPDDDPCTPRVRRIAVRELPVE